MAAFIVSILVTGTPFGKGVPQGMTEERTTLDAMAAHDLALHASNATCLRANTRVDVAFDAGSKVHRVTVYCPPTRVDETMGHLREGVLAEWDREHLTR